MVDSIITKQELIDASADAFTLEQCINNEADTKVKARLGREYWTLATLNRIIEQAQGDRQALLDAIKTIVTDNGVPTSVVIDNNGKILDEIIKDQSDEIKKVESYIVYAEKYGASLNEAMDAINLEFTGKRVRVYVPSDFPVTATVNLNIDCDLDLSTLQVLNDVDTIFEPIAGWNGSATPCVIYCGNFSIRVGWSMKKPLGYVFIDSNTFMNIGNQSNNTSASYWCGFYLSPVNCKRIILKNPSTINSYVKPNGVVGDNTGTNRNIIIEGNFTSSDYASDIEIHDHYAKDLYPSEDADSLFINTGSQSKDKAIYNIDIYNGFCENVQKRMYKFILNKNCTGVRLHGDSVAIAGGDSPYVALDLYGSGTLTANGSIYGKNWIIGINSGESNKLVGNYSATFEMDNVSVGGNQCRALNQVGSGNSEIYLNSLTGIGGAELFVNQSGHKLEIGKAKHTAWLRLASIAGNCKIDNFEMILQDPPIGVNVTRENFLLGLSNSQGIVINSGTFMSSSSTISTFLFRSLSGGNFTLKNITTDPLLSTTTARLVSVNNVKLVNIKAQAAPYLARMETGGNNVLFNQCVKPTSDTLFYNVGNVVTNIVEINTTSF